MDYEGWGEGGDGSIWQKMKKKKPLPIQIGGSWTHSNGRMDGWSLKDK
jgi:hypothetical protein